MRPFLVFWAAVAAILGLGAVVARRHYGYLLLGLAGALAIASLWVE